MEAAGILGGVRLPPTKGSPKITNKGTIMNELGLGSNYKKLPGTEGFDNCFACGQENDCGLKMEFYGSDEDIVAFVEVQGVMCGFERIVHGGIVSTLLDETMAWALKHLVKKLMLTKTMTVNFYKIVHANEKLKLKGFVHKGPDEREVQMKAILYNFKDEMLADAVGTFAIFGPESAEKLGISWQIS